MSNANRRDFLRTLVAVAAPAAGVSVLASAAQASSGQGAVSSLRNVVRSADGQVVEVPANGTVTSPTGEMLAWGNVGWRNGAVGVRVGGGGGGVGWRNGGGGAVGWGNGGGGGAGFRNSAWNNGGWPNGGGFRNSAWRNGW